MESVNTNSSFKEFDTFKTVKTSVKGDADFQGWQPFKEIDMDVKASKEELLKQLQADLENKMSVLQAKEEELKSREEKISDQLKIVVNMVGEFEKIKKNHWEDNLKEIVDFSTAMAERIVLQKIIKDPAILIGQIKAALESAKSKYPVEINVSPEDLVALQSSEIEEVQSFMRSEIITWFGNRRLSRGEIFIDTESYRLDASVTTVLNNIKSELIEELEDKKIQEEFKP